MTSSIKVGGGAIALLAGSWMVAANAQTSDNRSFAIHAGRLIVDASQPALGPSTIIVQNGRIVRIEPGLTNDPSGAVVLDLSSKTVLPGLVDAHVHLENDSSIEPEELQERKSSEHYAVALGLRSALRTVRAGFTTVRELGGPALASLAVRDAVNEGMHPGPRILTGGPSLSIIGGAGDTTVGLRPELTTSLDDKYPQIALCTGAAGCAEAVRRVVKLGVDVIKLYATGAVLDNVTTGLEQQFTDPELKSIVDTAHSLGLKVAAHGHGARGTEAAVRAGVESIEHGTFADEAVISLMKARGTYLVPTLSASTGLQEGIAKGVFTRNMEAKATRALAERGKALRAAYKAGVKIALGTDGGVLPHGRNAEELGLMVRLGGMTPRDALIAATKGGASLLGLSDEIGTLAPGKSADLVAVSGDPLVDPDVMLKVDHVMVKGRSIPLGD